MIHNQTARNTLYAWHGGQYSAFYAAASSGLVESFDAIYIEIVKCLEHVETIKGYTKKDKQDLIKLMEWFKHKETHSPVIQALDNKTYFVLPWGDK